MRLLADRFGFVCSSRSLPTVPNSAPLCAHTSSPVQEGRHSRKHRLQCVRPFSDEHSVPAPPLLHSEWQRLW